MPQLHFEDALNFLIDRLARVPGVGAGRANARQQLAGGSDIWIDSVSKEYWTARGQSLEGMSQDNKESYSAPFYDAAWELSRRGVLRPAAAVPNGQESAHSIGARYNATPFFGDGYSLTAWGRKWVKVAVTERAIMPANSGRITEVLHQFTHRFGQGYAQRAAKAVADWQPEITFPLASWLVRLPSRSCSQQLSKNQG
jgi:hypothetical protein